MKNFLQFLLPSAGNCGSNQGVVLGFCAQLQVDLGFIKGKCIQAGVSKVLLIRILCGLGKTYHLYFSKYLYLGNIGRYSISVFILNVSILPY